MKTKVYKVLIEIETNQDNLPLRIKEFLDLNCEEEYLT
jgi:hypothetical protein